ncbi:UrcA family protein [Altererythrobacter indicus]|uniref:UrcA family protein n=2 Tax=Altericroceibacterium indicum TaxID=374177 RepID=A0A845A621_9SPHN|nr:UrcA family protein [Altericroceibacterium indicum]
MMMKAGLMALAMCAVAAPAMANSTPDPFVQDKVALRLDGLDLSTVDGQNRLAIRMDAAARAVCGDGLASVHLNADAQAQECRTQVLANIRNQIETRMAANPSQVQLASSR